MREARKVRHVPSQIKVDKVRSLPSGKHFLVHRKFKGCRCYQIICVNDNEVDVLMPSGKISSFSINVVHFLHENNESESGNKKMEQDTDIPVSKKTSDLDSHHILMRAKARYIRLCTTLLTTNRKLEKNFYRHSRMEEVRALPKLEIFKVVEKKDAQGHLLYRSRFVDLIEPDRKNCSGLCVAACDDQDHGLFTAVSTIRRIPLLLLLAAAMTEKLDLFVRDVTKAFVMSNTSLRRYISMYAPKEMQV